VVIVIVAILMGLAASGPAAAHAASRGAGYQLWLEAQAAKRAAAERALAEAREARRDAAAVEKFSRLYGVRVGRWAPLVRDYFPRHVADAMFVLRGESGGNPRADNGTCRGLWQIHQCHAAAFRRITGKPYFWGVYSARANARMTAHMTRGGRNWSAWSVRP